MSKEIIYKQDAIDAVISLCDDCDSGYCGSCRVNYPGEKDARKVLEDLPSAPSDIETGLYVDGYNDGYRDGMKDAQPEVKPISYKDCAYAMLMMWMDNVLTDGEYNRIMDKLNAHEMEKRNG